MCVCVCARVRVHVCVCCVRVCTPAVSPSPSSSFAVLQMDSGSDFWTHLAAACQVYSGKVAAGPPNALWTNVQAPFYLRILAITVALSWEMLLTEQMLITWPPVWKRLRPNPVFSLGKNNIQFISPFHVPAFHHHGHILPFSPRPSPCLPQGRGLGVWGRLEGAALLVSGAGS